MRRRKGREQHRDKKEGRGDREGYIPDRGLSWEPEQGSKTGQLVQTISWRGTPNLTGPPASPGWAGPYQHSGPSPSTLHPADFAASQGSGGREVCGGAEEVGREEEGGGCSPWTSNLWASVSDLLSPWDIITGIFKGRQVTHPAARRTPGPCSHQCVPHSHALSAHACRPCAHSCTQVSARAHLQRDSHGWTRRCWFSSPADRLPAENVTGSI